MENNLSWIPEAVERLAAMYDKAFGGKPSGRYRISAKLIRQIAGRNRLYEDDMRSLSRGLLEQGIILIDMDSFCVVMRANSFVNYRRANEDAIS